MWDWKSGADKKRREEKSSKPPEKYFCLECLELSLKGEMAERFTSLCRVDESSVKRHKERRHQQTGQRKATIVPATAKEVEWLRKKLAVQWIKAKDLTHIKVPSVPAEKSKRQSSLLAFKQPEEEPIADGKTLTKVLEAISNLTLKVDSIKEDQQSLNTIAFDDDLTRNSVKVMKEAKNVWELAGATELIEFFYDEEQQESILRCSPCYKLYLKSRPTLGSVTPFKAQKIINSTGNGTLGTGLLLNNNTTRLLIEGGNTTWYRQKSVCIKHLCLLSDSKTHNKAMKFYNSEVALQEKSTKATHNIFRAAITDLKLGAAAKNFESLLSLLTCCGVDIGQIGHNRNLFNDILYCLEKTVNNKIKTWLSQPLPSTQLPPHVWLTVDKATPSRTTNQATLIIARDKRGIPCPIPVDAPKVYTAFEAASYEKLGEMLLKVVEDNLSRDLFSRICGVAADGPYQATGFRAKLLELLAIEDDGSHLALPVTWDAAHALNLGVIDVKDSDGSSGIHFRRFVKRCNVFNNLLANGKGLRSCS